jgi:geranylgeranyl pyrophosphate synthase
MIHFLRTAPAEHRQLLRSLLGANEPDKSERIRNLILPSGSIDYARNKAREYAGQAREALRSLPESDARRVLEAMAEFVVSRPL